jgi:hypothetical protein
LKDPFCDFWAASVFPFSLSFLPFPATLEKAASLEKAACYAIAKGVKRYRYAYRLPIMLNKGSFKFN